MMHVIVADNRTVRVFEAALPGLSLAEVAVFRNREAGRHERDLVSDRPGRVISSASGVHQAYEPRVRPSEHILARWLKQTGAPLQTLLATRSNDCLVLVASPRLLAQLRLSLPSTLRKRVQAEVSRDLARERVASLSKRLQPALRSAARKALRSQPVYRPVATRKRVTRAAA